MCRVQWQQGLSDWEGRLLPARSSFGWVGLNVCHSASPGGCERAFCTAVVTARDLACFILQLSSCTTFPGMVPLALGGAKSPTPCTHPELDLCGGCACGVPWPDVWLLPTEPLASWDRPVFSSSPLHAAPIGEHCQA